MDETGLPASIETAWGLRERPGKGPRPGLTLDRIVAAAIAVAQADGYPAASMSRIAKELGVSPMALYRYVAAKDELVDLMLDAAVGPAPAIEDGENWRAGLERWALAYLATLRRHPWVVRVPLTSPPATPNQIAWLEQGLRAMRGTGLDPAGKMSVIMLLGIYVRGAEATYSGIAETFDPDKDLPSYVETVVRLITPQTGPTRFPEITAVLTSGVMTQPDDDPDHEFHFGLNRILDGVAAKLPAPEGDTQEPSDKTEE